MEYRIWTTVPEKEKMNNEMKIMSPWVGCRSLRKPCVSWNDLYEVLWCFLDYKTAKEGGQNRGGDFEYICPTWHVDLFHSCREIHRNLYIVGNCYRNSCWATISWMSLNCGFTLTLQDLLTRQPPLLSSSQAWSPKQSYTSETDSAYALVKSLSKLHCFLLAQQTSLVNYLYFYT